MPHITQWAYEYTHIQTHTDICSQQSCMSQCQQCLLSYRVLYTSFQLCYCETHKKKKYKKTDADKQTQGAKYITIHYKPPPQHFHKNLSRKSEQQMLSRFKVIAKIQSGFLGGPLLLRIQWADYIAILLPWWWNSIYWTTKCMQFYLQKHSVDPYSSKMKSVHSISQNTFL